MELRLELPEDDMAVLEKIAKELNFESAKEYVEFMLADLIRFEKMDDEEKDYVMTSEELVSYPLFLS